MAYVIRDTAPQYEREAYFVGSRKVKDPHGRDCEAADFGPMESAKRFNSKSEPDSIARALNKMAGRTQFTVEEVNIYNQRYGRGRMRSSNGFSGFERAEEPVMHGGFYWNDEADHYHGF